MRQVLCLTLSGLALLSSAAALADRPELQMCGNAIRVVPQRAALVSPDLTLQSAWHPAGGIAQDCWDNLVFDCFEPVHRLTPWSGDMYTPTDGAAWGGWDPCCDIRGAGCGSSNRWFFGSTYCNPNIVNDMTFDPPDTGRYGMAEVAWWWYVGGVGTSEDLYIVIWCAEAFLDCTAGPPGADNYYDGVIWSFGSLVHGGYYYATMDACNLGGAEMAADGDGAYQIIWANEYDATYIYLASCAQPMLWGAKAGSDWDGVTNPSSQHGLQWDDDNPIDGQHSGDECYDYAAGFCPDPLGAMLCFWDFYEPQCERTICGDADCDYDVDGFDIDPFILGLTNLGEWSFIYDCCPICALDTNGDMRVDGFDIDGFIDVVGGGICPRDR